MKNNSSKKAFTLIELIVSSMLVIIILLGIFSINTVLNNNNQDYGQRYLVKSETQVTLNHILSNAALAVGTLNPNDQAILIGAQAPDPNTFCIHQGPGSNILTGSNNPNGNSDIWLCYTWSNNQINWCAEAYDSPAVVLRGATTCNAIDGPYLAGPTFVGTANTGFANLLPTFFNSGPGTELLFSITLQNCLNNSPGSSCNGNGANPGSTPGVSSDPANNPEVTVSGSVSPTQVSNS